MLKFLLEGANTPFTVSLGIMIGLGLLELIALLLGFDLIGDGDLDLDVDLDLDGGESVLGWLGFGKVPILISLILLLTGFGVTGLAIRLVAPINPWVVALPALVAAVLLNRTVGGTIGRALANSETTAIALDRLLGGTATIVLGATEKGNPTQAKLRDVHGQTHYILVEPLRDGDTFDAGTPVVLVERQGPKFFVVGEGPDALEHLDARLSPQELSAEHRPKA